MKEAERADGRGEKEEMKCVNTQLKRVGGSNRASKSAREVEDTTEDQLTPRLENPVSMLKRKNSSNDSDEIPNERMEPIKLIPLLNMVKTFRMHTRRNMSQRIMNNKSGYSIIAPSLLSHE